MPVSLAKPILLASLLMITLGIKAGTLHRAFDGDQASLARERQAISAWLTGKGFTLSPPEGASPFVQAQSGPCSLTVIAADGRGFHRTILEEMTLPGMRRLFLYRGGVYGEQPIWRTWIDHHLWARARDMGIYRPRHLVLGILAQSCRLDVRRWSGVDIVT